MIFSLLSGVGSLRVAQVEDRPILEVVGVTSIQLGLAHFGTSISPFQRAPVKKLGFAEFIPSSRSANVNGICTPFILLTSTFHSSTTVFVDPFALLTPNTVHLTAATESMV
jgi:hypothetical protein